MDKYEIREYQKPMLAALRDGKPFKFHKGNRQKNIQIISVDPKTNCGEKKK